MKEPHVGSLPELTLITRSRAGIDVNFQELKSWTRIGKHKNKTIADHILRISLRNRAKNGKTVQN